MKALPREILAQILVEPQHARAVHQTCRELAERTRGIFSRMEDISSDLAWHTTTITGEYTSWSINYDLDDASFWVDGEYFVPDEWADLIPTINMWGMDINVYNLLFAECTEVVLVGVNEDTTIAVRFAGVLFDKLYRVCGFYNNRRGISIKEAREISGPNIIARYTHRGRWKIYHVAASPHSIYGPTIELELVIED